MISYNRYGAVPESQEGYWEDFATLTGRHKTAFVRFQESGRVSGKDCELPFKGCELPGMS